MAKSDATEEKSPLSATTHPFWSEKAKLEVALAQARPSDLDAEAQRFSGGDLERTRPIDLEERGRSRQEVVVNEEVKDPEYGSALGAMASAEVRKSLDVGMSSPERSEFVEASPSAGLEGQSQMNVSDRTEGDDLIQDASRLVQQRRSSEELVLDDQALEIARLRSMVDFLQGHIQYTEESRSYESSSNQAMDQVVAVQDSRPVPKPPNEQGPSLASTIPATPYFVQEPSGIPVPPVFNLSSRPARDPFQECVMVQGMPHRWVRVGDKLYLEPLVLHSREGSPPPPPPKTIPPPSPPPLPITSSPYNPVNPAPEASNPLALALGSADQGLSCLGVGDRDGSRSGAQSYLSVDSGGYDGNRESSHEKDIPQPPSVCDALVNSTCPTGTTALLAPQQAIMSQVGLLLQGKLPMSQFVQAVADQVASSSSPPPVWTSQAHNQGAQALQGVGPLQGAQASQGVGPLQGAQASQGVGPLQGAQASQGVGPLQGAQALQGVGPLQGAQALQGVGPLQGAQASQGVGPLQGARRRKA